VSGGLLETIRVRQGRMPFLERHLSRLRHALAETGGPALGPGVETRLLGHTAQAELVVRLVVDSAGEHVTTRPVPGPDLVEAVVSSVPHEGYPYKSAARAPFERASAEAASRGAGEAILLTPDGRVAEGCFSTVFFWKSDVLCTPALELGILPGVGRARLLEVARAAGVTVEQGTYRPEALSGASVFLVNAVRGVSELLALDGRALRRDPRTAELAAGFWT
jgi:branched-subunit amino acid aminotransferase/4-amino-4-deoxychorismate lyase